MPVAKKHFITCNKKGLEVGQKVVGESEYIGDAVGVITLIWYGCDEMVDIETSNDRKVTYTAEDITRFVEEGK